MEYPDDQPVSVKKARTGETYSSDEALAKALDESQQSSTMDYRKQG